MNENNKNLHEAWEAYQRLVFGEVIEEGEINYQVNNIVVNGWEVKSMTLAEAYQALQQMDDKASWHLEIDGMRVFAISPLEDGYGIVFREKEGQVIYPDQTRCVLTNYQPDPAT